MDTWGFEAEQVVTEPWKLVGVAVLAVGFLVLAAVSFVLSRRAGSDAKSRWWESNVKIGLALFVVFGVIAVLVGTLSVSFPGTHDKSGRTEIGSLREWLDDNYGITVTDEGARSIIYTIDSSRHGAGGSAVSVEYKGEPVSLKLIPFGGEDGRYVLVNASTLEPLNR